ncbi:hypothetical protein [Sphingomonas oligoaromativorans]|uniref:hypothetical protein n=1 Tax=Sphingomonas oligoaromativorans TaxID=575322 RepID=UPI00141E03F2|nr:hypothetical protein [Sphingomonas oligoaromativorans]NIJ34095.1 hypothetical protein [Sphingomonas oligoaromativorans]
MLAVLITLAAITSGGTTPVPEGNVETALSRCLGSFSAKLPPPSDAAQIPPGLIEGTAVRVVPVEGAAQTFSYEGTSPRAMTCGVAIYGPVSQELRQRIIALITGSPKWKPHATDAYDLSKRFPGAEEAYWGDPFAPSMNGVAMLVRKPNAQAPTLEVQYHSVMVQ